MASIAGRILSDETTRNGTRPAWRCGLARHAANKAALANVIVRFAEFLDDQQDLISECDVNPLICSGGRIVAVDALIARR